MASDMATHDEMIRHFTIAHKKGRFCVKTAFAK